VQQKIKSLIFCSAITFIVLTIFSLTIGQKVSYEFADYKLSQSFYNIIMQGFPIAILLTLFGTLKKENTKTRNWTFIGATVLTSILCFVLIVNLIFSIGFGTWITFETVYRHKTENKVIKDQVYDIGAFGYGRHRIVEIKPILKYWVLPTEVDTTKIDKSQWKFVNEEGDIKFP
jgi:amino acid transporter